MSAKTGGASTYKGLNFQSFAAMSLFLQHLDLLNFSGIHLEAPGSQDFELIFDDGKKIICECKDKKKSLSDKDLKEILESIHSKKRVYDTDEILIICSNCSKKMREMIKNAKIFPDYYMSKLKEKGYKDEILGLISKVNFWVICREDNDKIIESLMAEAMGFWLPQQELKEKISSILLCKIYMGSESSFYYSKEEFLCQLKEIEQKKKQNSVFYNDKEQELSAQFEKIKESIEKEDVQSFSYENELAAFSANISYMQYFIKKMEERNVDIDLSKWHKLWEIGKVPYFFFGMMRVFIKNINSHENKKYILSFLNKKIGYLRSYYRDNFIYFYIKDIVCKIINDEEIDEEILRNGFLIIKEIFGYTDNNFYCKNNNHVQQYDIDELSKILYRIYKSSEAFLNQDIINYVFDKFNLALDYQSQGAGVFIPEEIYLIVRDWLDNDFEKRVKEFIEKIVGCYDFNRKFLSRKKFEGWDFVSAMSVNSGSGYHLSDWKFISLILEPALKNFYNTNKKEKWLFIKNEFFTEKVTRNRPDFLNRSIIKIVIERFSEEQKGNQECFLILKTFILSKNGIPRKSDLIYQEITEKKMSEDKKWSLVCLVIEEYSLPPSCFVLNIVSKLANVGYEKAKNQLESWFSTDDLYINGFLGFNYIKVIKEQMSFDFDFGMKLFNIFISNNYVKEQTSTSFSPYNIGNFLHEILENNYKAGLSVLDLLDKEKQLTTNQQIIYVQSLGGAADCNSLKHKKLTDKLYKDVIYPFLKKLKIQDVIKKFSESRARELILQFVDKMNYKEKAADIFKFISLFVEDTDPDFQFEEILEGKEPLVISSVRGWCCWMLSKLIFLENRGEISEIINCVERLIVDNNYYIVHMASRVLFRLTANRLCVLPTDENTLFFHDDKETALKMSKKVEAISFELLKKFLGWEINIQKAMVKSVLSTIEPIKALNETDAFNLITSLEKLPDELLAEFAPVFVFYAEVRKFHYKNWHLSVPGLYDDLKSEQYNEESFQRKLLENINKLQGKNRKLCSKFIAVMEQLTRDNDSGCQNNVDKNYDVVFEKYFNFFISQYNHDVFNFIFKIIFDKFKNKKLEPWFSFFITCLKKEIKFYEDLIGDNDKCENIYSNFMHVKILEVLFDENPGLFIEASKIYFLFPKNIDLCESERLIKCFESCLKMEPYKSDAEKILYSIFDRSPAKYHEMKKALTKN